MDINGRAERRAEGRKVRARARIVTGTWRSRWPGHHGGALCEGADTVRGPRGRYINLGLALIKT